MNIESRLAYLAGFFDGEGCAVIGINGNITLSVINTNLEILNIFKDVLGGSVASRKQIVNKPQYVWRAYGPTAVKIAHTLVPYTTEKTDQLITLIDWYHERAALLPIQNENGRGRVANPNRAIAIGEIQNKLTKMKMGTYVY